MIHDLPVHLARDAVDFTGIGFVHGIEQRREGMAQAEAAPTSVADVEHPLEFGEQLILVVERLVTPRYRVTSRCFKTAFARTVAHDDSGRATVGPRPGRLIIRVLIDQPSRLSRAFWNLLAWERSALASVSNQSAISSKPSSRAVLAMPGYMSVYSWVSPAIAARRLLSV